MSSHEAPPHLTSSGPRTRRRWFSVAPALPSTGWKSTLREFVLIVAGVIAALAAQAWYEGRQQMARERIYLDQLAADLRETEASLEDAIGAMEDSNRTSAALLVAFNDPAHASPDSVAAWLGRVVWHDVPGLNLGVARGLASGDIAVIKDDSLRGAVMNLLDEAERFRIFQAQAYQSFIDYSNRLREKVSYSERLAHLSRADPNGPWLGYYKHLPFGSDFQVAFRSDFGAFMRGRESFIIIDGLFDMGADLLHKQNGMLISVRQLREAVDAKLAASQP